MLVAWLVAVTVTPGTAAPDGSATRPVTVASPVWPTAGVARTSPPSARRPTRRTILKSARIGIPFLCPRPTARDRTSGSTRESVGIFTKTTRPAEVLLERAATPRYPGTQFVRPSAGGDDMSLKHELVGPPHQGKDVAGQNGGTGGYRRWLGFDRMRRVAPVTAAPGSAACRS